MHPPNINLVELNRRQLQLLAQVSTSQNSLKSNLTGLSVEIRPPRKCTYQATQDIPK
jgi:hypothetical protein